MSKMCLLGFSDKHNCTSTYRDLLGRRVGGLVGIRVGNGVLAGCQCVLIRAGDDCIHHLLARFYQYKQLNIATHSS